MMSRFPIHDDLTAPEASLPVLKAVSSSAGQLPNYLGVLANSPAALRAYTRFRAELRNGILEPATRERIALAAAALHQAEPSAAAHARAARVAGIALDEIARAKKFRSADPRHDALLRWLEAAAQRRAVPLHLHERAREAGWSDEHMIEGLAVLALEAFTDLVEVAGEVPRDGSDEDNRALRAVA